MGDEAADSRSFADRLNRLFEAIQPADRGTPYTNKEVAAAVRANGGSISDVYIWQLRTGRRDNPTKDHIEALAAFFGVGAAYFFDDSAAARTTADLETLDALHRLQVKSVSLRTVLEHHGLSAASQKIIQQMVDLCLEMEGLADKEKPAP